jgi:hypothetical protein
MPGKGSVILSINEIRSFYPDQWVAIAVTDTDADGFASEGEIIVHNADEKLVWYATKLGDFEEPIYVFFTGSRHHLPAVA